MRPTRRLGLPVVDSDAVTFVKLRWVGEDESAEGLEWFLLTLGYSIVVALVIQLAGIDLDGVFDVGVPGAGGALLAEVILRLRRRLP